MEMDTVIKEDTAPHSAINLLKRSLSNKLGRNAKRSGTIKKTIGLNGSTTHVIEVKNERPNIENETNKL
jgi:hypothetical protein